MNHTTPEALRAWTEARAKAQHPAIQVKFTPQKPHKEQTVAGRVTGDKGGFAIVSFGWHGVQVRCEVAWETVVNCLNGNRPIHY